MIEYAYQKATYEQIEDAVSWCKDNLQMSDWEIDVCVDKEPPKELYDSESFDGRVAGRGAWAVYEQKGIIWVPLERCKSENENPYEVAIHEVLHGRFGYFRMFVEMTDDMEEHLVRLWSPVAYKAFCKDKKKKIARER